MERTESQVQQGSVAALAGADAGVSAAAEPAPQDTRQRKVVERKLKSVKRRGKEDVMAFLQRVRETVGEIGGTPEDVLDVLEREGVTPDEINAAQAQKAQYTPPKAAGIGVK